jgi:hypothetical protein
MAIEDDPAPAPATQGGAVSIVGQEVVSTSPPTIVTVSTTGVQGSGSVSLTTTTASGIPGSIMFVTQDAFSGLIQSGFISNPLQVAALQLKLASLSVGGGVNVPLLLVNVTQVPFFKTTTDYTMFEMQNMLQSLPPPSIAPGSIANIDRVFWHPGADGRGAQGSDGEQ